MRSLGNKKTARDIERYRPAIRLRRQIWSIGKPDLKVEGPIFVDETWAPDAACANGELISASAV